MATSNSFSSHYLQTREEVMRRLRAREKQRFKESLDELVERALHDELSVQVIQQLQRIAEHLQQDAQKLEYLLQSSDGKDFEEGHRATQGYIRRLEQAQRVYIDRAKQQARALLDLYRKTEWKGLEGMQRLRAFQVDAKNLERICGVLDLPNYRDGIIKIHQHSRETLRGLHLALADQPQYTFEHHYALNGDGKNGHSPSAVLRKRREGGTQPWELSIVSGAQVLYTDTNLDDRLLNHNPALERVGKRLVLLKLFDKRRAAEQALCAANVMMMGDVEAYERAHATVEIPELSGDEQKDAIALLEDPAYLFNVGQTVAKKVAGERRNVLLTYVIASSPRLASSTVKPQHLF